VIFVVLLAVGVGACRQDMHDAPRYEAYEANSFYADGRASRETPTGTVARGWERADDLFYTGRDSAGEPSEQIPMPVTAQDMQRGRDRYNVYCTPCHGILGDGQGMVVQRGLKRAATYHDERLRGVKVGYLYDVVTNGFGAMQGYAEQIPARDRWLIVAYVRALQLSQHAQVAEVPSDKRAELDRPATAPAAAAPAGH
jgi:mono/diheme cytochrome c family protein